MISGHSLTDNPLADHMALIAQSLSTPLWWNQQIVLGSPIRFRTRGADLADPAFPGYSIGKNRDGSTGLNIAAELANPQTLGGQRYDTLLLTERHDLASVLVYEDTVRYARHFHERLITGNANAKTYLYHSWLEVNKDSPSAWIGYERAAAPAWQCVAARVNQSLTGEGRSDRMAYLPAGLALTHLVERATTSGVAGITGSTVRETMDRLFTDNVHLTPTGVYYMALVSYSSIYRRSPVGAAVPAGVTAQQAAALQALAWEVVSNHYANATTPTMSQCQTTMRDQYCNAFANFKANPGFAGTCISRLTAQNRDNPFYYEASGDAGYWFPEPK
jgi:hypothetical protein